MPDERAGQGSMRYVRVVLAGFLGTLAGLAFGAVFDEPIGTSALARAVVATTVAATVIAIAAVAVPRLPPTLAAVGGTIAVAAVAVTMTGAGLTVLNGPSQLLTGALPADLTDSALAAVAVAAGWATLLGGQLAAYAGNALAPVVPSLLCLVAALSLGAAVGPLPGWYVPATVTLIVAMLLTGRARRPGLAVILAAVAVGAVAVLAATVLGGRAPGGSPADARTFVDARVEPCSGTSPLQQYNALRKDDPHMRLTGTSSAALPGRRLRLATLTHFDGTYWTVSGEYRVAGERLPDPPAEGHGVTIKQHVNVYGVNSCLGWLVTAGRPITISVAGLGVDEATGDVAIPAKKEMPRQYDASSVVNDVPSARGAEPLPASERLPSRLPPSIQAWVGRTVAGETSKTDQLAAISEEFRDSGHFHYDQAKDVVGGHGYYQIQNLLRSARGTSEQYASAFAVMARQLGMDARVVMGFRVPDKYNGKTFSVTGGDVDAWVEVRFAGLGWVTFDPSPRGNPIGKRAGAPTAVPKPEPRDDPLRSANGADRQGGSRSAAQGGNEATAPPESGGSPLVIWLPVVVGLLLALILAAPAAKAVRGARRRRDRSARRAVLGAWWETTDRLREAGVAVGHGLTTGDVVRLTPELPPVRALAAMVDRAAYAPEAPPPDLPGSAWAAAADARRRLRVGMRPPRRIAAFLDPRPLLRR